MQAVHSTFLSLLEPFRRLPCVHCPRLHSSEGRAIRDSLHAHTWDAGEICMDIEEMVSTCTSQRSFTMLCLASAKFCLFSSGGRTLSAVLCVAISVIVRLPPYFAMAVEEYPGCEDQFRTLSIELRQWAVVS